ncbi:hypothetical protein BH11MYX1_BH11MYX1_31120 [soil metagenome]
MRALLLVVLVGCTEPEVGAPSRIACNGSDSDPAVAIDFGRDVATGVLAGHCDRCHTPTGVTPIGLTIGGLDFSSATSLRRGGVQGGTDIVVPGDPCASVLVQKISAAPPFGARMPLDGPPFLSASQIQVISDWIAEGATGE